MAIKLIQCIVRPGKLDDLIVALQAVTAGMTAHEIRSLGPEGPLQAVYRGVQYETLTPRVQLDIVTDDSWLDDILRIVVEVAKTGVAGDGHIHVMPVEESYHVRTGFMES